MARKPRKRGAKTRRKVSIPLGNGVSLTVTLPAAFRLSDALVDAAEKHTLREDTQQ